MAFEGHTINSSPASTARAARPNGDGSTRSADPASDGRAVPGSGPRLGIYAKTHSPPLAASFAPTWAHDPETGEIAAFQPHGDGFRRLRDHREVRAERWALKSSANRLLPKGHRTTKCHRWRLPDRDIDVLRGGEQNRAFFQGLQVCASVWCCPVCASKISERRRVELAAAIATAQAMGLRVYLLTLTVPHGLGDDVAVMLDQMMKAWAKLNQGEQGEKLRHRLGLRGTVRALEVTHGSNGWHPHFHALLFLDTDQTPQEVQGVLSKRWQVVAQRAGLPCPSEAHGCRVDGGEKAAAYVSKGSSWGLESELTKGHQKRGKQGSRTAWDLLRDYLEGDKQAGALFRVYSEAFQGRRQLYWSNGLKKLLAVSDFTDQEIANKPEEVPSMHLASISDDQWKAIRRFHFESAVLDLAETDPEGLRDFLSRLGGA